MKSNYTHDDGGREVAGLKGKSGDCGVRAMAIACEIPYVEARSRCKDAAKAGKMRSKAIARGMYREDMTAALSELGWEWRAAPKFEGSKARYSDMPEGRVIARMSKHYAAVIDGTIHDTFDSTRKMIYGYWIKS